ncbi:MAG: DUF5989 family protein [Candidatus Sumerlaeota bacterium]
MSEEENRTEEENSEDLESLGRQSLVIEFKDFLVENRKWWMIPILAVFALFALLLLIIAINPAFAPFVYTIF